jgi:hypothetical protein
VVVAPLQAIAVPTGILPGLAPPLALDASAATEEDTPVTVELDATDLDTCELTFTIVAGPSHGTLDPIVPAPCTTGPPHTDAATVVYTPASGYAGPDSFTFRVNDGLTDSNTATVTLTVDPEPVPTPTTTPTATPATATPMPSATPTVVPPPSCGVGLCGDAPSAGCRGQVEPDQGTLLIKDKPGERSDRLTWKWLHGAATSKGDFGTPLTTTDYEVCLYDGANNLIARACAPADGLCDGKPCWRDKGRGYKYRKRDLSESGTKNSLQIDLKEGVAGKAKIIVKGKGGNPVVPALPVSQPIRAQIVNEGGACWEATFSAPAKQNSPPIFKDRGD